MTEATDIVVIGAGIAGASIAARLAEHADVILVDAEDQPGYHATGRSAAYFAPRYGNDVVQSVTGISEPFYNNPPDGFTDVPLLRGRHCLMIASQDQQQRLAGNAQANPSLELLDSNQLVELVPNLRPTHIKAGVLDRSGGDLNVDAILQGFIRLFQRRGGKLRTRFRVDTCTRQSGRWSIQSGSNRISAGTVVNAAGAWADQVAELAGLASIGLVPKRRTAMLIDPPVEQNIDKWPMIVDIDEAFYLKPEAGKLLLSPADETPSSPCDAQANEIDIAIAVDRLTRATTIPVDRISHRWAGLRTFAPDNSFVVGFDDRTTGFFWLAGQGGYGVQSAPGLSQLAARILNTETLDESERTIATRISAARLINAK
jgi:D-arginine dehydrogenase